MNPEEEACQSIEEVWGYNLLRDETNAFASFLEKKNTY
jgi:hypothetical protein